MDCHGAARLAMTKSVARLAMTQRRHGAPTWSLRPLPRHREERSNPLAVARRHGLPRRCAPRNDGISRAPRNDAAASLRPYLVIAPLPRHCEERSNPLQPLCEDMDCHGAARLAMTESVARLAMTQRRHGAPTSSLRPLPRHCEERSNPLRPLREDMDCHGAARLAMTKSVARLAMTRPGPRLAMTSSAGRLAMTAQALALVRFRPGP
jgi:hypothetical protein